MQLQPVLGPGTTQAQIILAKRFGEQRAQQILTNDPELSIQVLSEEELNRQFETFMQSLTTEFPHEWSLPRLFLAELNQLNKRVSFDRLAEIAFENYQGPKDSLSKESFKNERMTAISLIRGACADLYFEKKNDLGFCLDRENDEVTWTLDRKRIADLSEGYSAIKESLKRERGQA